MEYTIAKLSFLSFKTRGLKGLCSTTMKLNSYSNASVFLSLCPMRISIFWGHEHQPIDWYQNATSKAISLHELKKVELQERYTRVTQDSIGHLKTLCMSVLSLAVALESEWKHYSSLQSDEKTQAFEYEFSLSLPKWHFHSGENSRLREAHSRETFKAFEEKFWLAGQ